ncbi:SDR family oxidoreductase [Sphingomonas naphthae]|uniref:SDR family oxidoreductase n=1 Tax=Sphingomonas naphthae TaxID=1813468 RepID=A0ABY7THD1_9SPHN|nr:SDR family oxidoreductase [Sphingomonas naphthae]WCT72559.1 SDR family oxidoreductase [Sphingomonas naphthae]
MSLPPLALVTGGTRRLGAAIAARLAGEGMSLALHYREHADPDAALAAAIAAHATDWAAFPADLADESDVEGLIPAIEAHFGRAPNVLVNSASLWTEDDLATADMASYALHFRVNAAAPTILATRVAARASAAAPAVVVNILDQRIAHPHGDQPSYTLSKLALAEATRLLARTLAPHTRVLGVAPGLTIPTNEYVPGQMVRLAATMPLGRLASPEDIADAVAWAVRARSSTGQILFVDGGASLVSYDRDFVRLERD